MAKSRSTGPEDYARPLRRLFVGLLVLVLLGLFLLWRIDSPRVERFRAALVDQVVPSFDWALLPITKAAYEKVKASGFYKDKPFLETPLLSLNNKAPTENSRGIRLALRPSTQVAARLAQSRGQQQLGRVEGIGVSGHVGVQCNFGVLAVRKAAVGIHAARGHVKRHLGGGFGQVMPPGEHNAVDGSDNDLASKRRPFQRVPFLHPQKNATARGLGKGAPRQVLAKLPAFARKAAPRAPAAGFVQRVRHPQALNHCSIFSRLGTPPACTTLPSFPVPKVRRVVSQPPPPVLRWSSRFAPTSKARQLESEVWLLRLGSPGVTQLDVLPQNVTGLLSTFEYHPFRSIDFKEQAYIRKQAAQRVAERITSRLTFIPTSRNFARNMKTHGSPKFPSPKIVLLHYLLTPTG